jgi:hypothetical protein
MAALPTTGIPAVDRELERRGPFPSAEAAEAAANRLLSVWRALQPGSSVDERSQRRTQRG